MKKKKQKSLAESFDELHESTKHLFFEICKACGIDKLCKELNKIISGNK